MRPVTVKDDFPPGFHEALGRLAVAFARVEYLTKLAVKSLSGKGFTAGMEHAESQRQFGNLCREAKKLATYRLPEPQAATFCGLIDEALKLAIERNDNLHALWTTDDAGRPERYRPFFNRETKALDWRSRPVTIEELHRHEGAMNWLFNTLVQTTKAWPSIPPL